MGTPGTVNVYQRVRRLSNMGVLKLSGPTLNVLMELDGKRTTAEISRHLGMQPFDVEQAVSELVQTGIAESIKKEEPIVPPPVFTKIRELLLKAMGPMGEYLLDDCIEELQESKERFPVCQLPELGESLAREIKRPEASLGFRQEVIKLIKAMPK